jgi:hypothetical protein
MMTRNDEMRSNEREKFSSQPENRRYAVSSKNRQTKIRNQIDT